MRFKQAVPEGENRPLAELGLHPQLQNGFDRIGAYDRGGRLRTTMLSDVVGKSIWDRNDYETRPLRIGNTGLKALMRKLNLAGYALGSPSINHELSVLPLHTSWKYMLRRGGMVYIDHVTTKSRQQIETILRGYHFTASAITDCVDELQTLLHGVGLDFAAEPDEQPD